MRNPFKKQTPPPRKKSYAFANANRLTNDFFGGSLTADQAIYQSISAMRNRARTLERDESHVRKFLLMARTNIVGAKGIRLQSQALDVIGGKSIPAKLDQQMIEDAYLDFSKHWNFSGCGRINRRRFAQIGMQRVFVDGEFICQILRGSQYKHGIALNMIDAERLDHTINRKASTGKNEIRMGVEVDDLCKPIAYHFLDEAPTQWSGTSTAGARRTVVPADQIIHAFIIERPGQTRGVTWLAPTGLRAKLLDGIETAVSVGFKVAASKMGFITTNDDYEGEDIQGSDIPTDVAPGMIDILPKGASFNDFDPGYPNADFDGFKKSIVREIAGGLGVSYPELGNDFSGVSYSAGQIGVHSDAALWGDLQQFWIDISEEPIFRAWLPMSITAGILNLPLLKLLKFEHVKFQPQRRKHIDPLKTHNAQHVALGDMTRSPFEIAAENGEDLEDVFKGHARARQMATDLGLPVPASWGAGADLSQIIEDPPADAEENQNGVDKWLS